MYDLISTDNVKCESVNPVQCCAQARGMPGQARGICQVLQLLAPGMNVYGGASPFILQDLAEGTMCTHGRTYVRHEVMMMHLRLTF